MSAEERLLEAIEEDEETEAPSFHDQFARRKELLKQKNRATIDNFLGEGRRATAVGIVPRYYGELLTWALKRQIEEDEWTVVGELGYRASEPVFIDVNTDCDQSENLLMDGQVLLQKGELRLVVTVDINMHWRNSVQVESLTASDEKADSFIQSVVTIARERSFYQGKAIRFGGRLRFLNPVCHSWDSIVMSTDTKAEIRANTVDFLRRREVWADYGIPSKRGILLAGQPGTGKTVICKALISEAPGITCITTNAYGLAEDEYITELYELAEDLSPCIVFIEDIDLIGQDRMEYGYHRGPALLSLLAVLDGIEEKKEIVTVATTNCLDTLDKALSQRPSRFDRVIRLTLPTLEQRKDLVRQLSEKIPLDEATQDRIACKAEDCTPAQLQEIVHGLVIQRPTGALETTFNRDDIDRAVSKINDRSKCRLGFNSNGNHNGHKPSQTAITGGRR